MVGTASSCPRIFLQRGQKPLPTLPDNKHLVNFFKPEICYRCSLVSCL